MPITRPHPFTLLGITLALAAPGCAAAPPADAPTTPLTRYQFDQPHMGTRFRLVLYAPDEATAHAAADAAFARIDRLNSILSDYDPDSELSRLSATAGENRPVEISDDLWNVLHAAHRLSELSGGAFDVTVGPATRLWRRVHETRRLPHPRRIEQAREAIGYHHLELDPHRRTANLRVPGMRLDLGGIGKGYAADAALDTLRRHGVTRALVAAGGDIAIADPPPGQDGWRIALQPVPQLPGESPAPEPAGAPATGTTHYLIAHNIAVSTSGDAFQHVVIDSTRYSHIIDPATAAALTTPIAVTAIAPDATTADALASAISVLGPDAGLELADSLPAAAAMIALLHDGGRIEFHRSSRADQLTLIPADDHTPATSP